MSNKLADAQEMVENMNSTRDIWAMQLDTIRNRIIRVELLVAVASFALMMSTVPASFFGMNLTSGLEVRMPSAVCLLQLIYLVICLGIHKPCMLAHKADLHSVNTSLQCLFCQ